MEDVAVRKSFRDEDMASRRAFLRSYPLRWEEEDGDGDSEESQEEEEVSRSRKARAKALLKSGIVAVLEWGEGKLLMLRKMKEKVVFYLVACRPFGFKTPKLLTT